MFTIVSRNSPPGFSTRAVSASAFGNVARGAGDRCGHAYCGVEFGVAKRQLLVRHRLVQRPVRDAGDARIVHQPIRRVVLDSEIAAVDVDRGDGHARLCQQQSHRCAAGSGADIDDPADPTGEKPVRHRRQRQIEAEQPMNDHRPCDPPASHEPECDDNRAAPGGRRQPRTASPPNTTIGMIWPQVIHQL